MFDYDPNLARHLAELQPKPTPRPKASAKRSAGVVTFYDGRKGFGFARDENGGDVFLGSRNLTLAQINNLGRW
jgi:hypothetical protein